MFDNKTTLDKFISGGKGSESFGTKAKFVARFLSLAIGWGVFVAVAVVASWYLALSPTSKSLLANEFRANSLSATQQTSWVVSCRFADWPQGQCGDPAAPNEFRDTVIAVGGESNLTPSQYRQVVEKHFMKGRLMHPYRGLWIALCAGLGLGAGVSIFAFKKLLKSGEAMGKNKRLAGALDLVTGPELSEIVKKSGTASSFEICEVALPKQTLVKGVVFAGSQGSGKSTALHDLIRQVKTYNQKTGEKT